MFHGSLSASGRGDVTYPEPDRLVAISKYFVECGFTLPVNKTQAADTHNGEARISSPQYGTAAGGTAKPRRLSAGLILCLVGAAGLIILSLTAIFLTDVSDKTAASSAVALDGMALLILLYFAALIIGAVLIIRSVHKK